MKSPDEHEIEDTVDGWTVVDHKADMFEEPTTEEFSATYCHGKGSPCDVCGQEDDSIDYRETAEYAEKVAFIALYDPENRLGFIEEPATPDNMTAKMQGAPLPHPNSARFHEILRDLGRLHDRKQKDYGRGDDPFANVRGSEEWGMSAWVGAMVRANDKIRRLQQYARTGSLANEGVEDAFMDLAVYAVIAMVLWEQDQA